MSPNLDQSELAAESPLDRSTHVVTLQFTVTNQAIEVFAPKNVSARVFEDNHLLVLACGLHAKLTAEMAGSAQYQARRWALALTNLEQAMLWAERAKRDA